MKIATFSMILPLFMVIAIWSPQTGWSQQTLPGKSADTEWTQFRGHGMGATLAPDVTMQLNLDRNLKWRTETQGVGWSSPVTDGARLWMTSAQTVAASAEEKAAKLAKVKMADMKDVVGSATLRVICLNAITGDVLVDRVVRVVDSPN
ncbi:MAG: hypothetical protein WBD31_01490, partial [Rubripirellula sp.]